LPCDDSPRVKLDAVESNVEVNAFQRLSGVEVQKSLRKAFGLVVSETRWKGMPVVAGEAGGKALQMQAGVGGFLVDTVKETAEKLLWLLRNSEEVAELALYVASDAASYVTGSTFIIDGGMMRQAGSL
jgi:glycosyltransferase involved in cell wall biosynthesis